MADEIRRSGRATKGQHTKNLDVPEVPSAKRGGKGSRSKTSKQASSEPTPHEDEAPAIIRCICGAVEEDEDDERKMIVCDRCDAWQHNECMELPNDDSLLPDEYFCEVCKPEDHQGLLAKVARGEKPWEERAKVREREEEERKSRRRKGGKKGKKPRVSDTKLEKTEDTNGNGTTIKDAPTADGPAAMTPEPNQKRKLPIESTTENNAQDGQEPVTKVRKISTSKDVKPLPQRRQSSTMAAPSRRDSKGGVFQTDLVENVSDLQSGARRNVATALVKLFVDQTTQAQKEGACKLPKGQALEVLGRRLGLAVEYAVFANFWGPGGEPNPAYSNKFRMILHNVKANPALRDRLLNKSLSPQELSQMSSDDMASKELQEMTAEMKKETEKQHMLIHEEGPRIRRTHKGEEVVGDPVTGDTESIFPSAPARRRESEMADTEGGRQTSGEPTSPQSATAVELPDDVGNTIASLPQRGSPLAIDTRAPLRQSIDPKRKSSSTFDIQNVWSSVESPDVDKQRTRQPPPPEASTHFAGRIQGSAVEPDADIDQLLKDEEPDDEEPYSPTDYAADPGTVWRGKLVRPGFPETIGIGKHVGGADLSVTIPWPQLMPPALHVEGRINIDRASEYLCNLRWSHTTDVSVVAVTPNDDPISKAEFDRLFDYLTERNRYGVIGKSHLAVLRDIYIVPLESGMSKKPDFIELLEHCTIEEPRPERTLLLTFVIKVGPTDSAQATPRHLDTGAIASPIGAGGIQPHASYPTSIPIGHPSSHISPIHSHLAPYESSPPQPPPFNPPPQGYQQPHPYQAQQEGPKGIEAARHVLGELATAPVIGELLTQSPATGVNEFTAIREVFEAVPASQNDFAVLMDALARKLQQTTGGS
ncbi:MAG: hypothetical protein FRX48_03027 [Lasallia pustulata]|uniref:Transcription factor BYE1 n=1 Tax=Lasallia pustulata TaxID=136370 RepID=A0A5M8PX75_9LECA|nr:MAG: hypothetical protein FRX48_03027 [Lasallia pustulata]